MHRLWLSLLLCISLPSAQAQTDPLEDIQELRLQGQLDVALQLANERIEVANGADTIALHLEIARIEDRFGLHNNTRPVAAALQHVEAADVLAEELDAHAQAQVDLAYAEYFYRADMAEREFTEASRYAEQALPVFVALDDFHGQADAVHRLGLISLQQRDLDLAKDLFEESLRLDRIDGERLLLRADYERHVGFVFYLRGEPAEALPYLERSLDYRMQAGAADPAMFAAISLASTLVDLDRAEEALPHLDYAASVAEKINSAMGRSRIDAIIEKMKNTPPK